MPENKTIKLLMQYHTNRFYPEFVSFILANTASGRFTMHKRILFITGKLAYRSLHKVLEEIQPTDFSYIIHELGITVAALMTSKLIKHKLKDIQGADLIILPGRFRGDLDDLSVHFGVPVERGPEELKDLPAFFGRRVEIDLSHYDVQLFGEIVNAPELSPPEILALAKQYRKDGADVIDIGFLPDTRFPQLEDSIKLLKENDFQVSVDTHEPNDLIQAARWGADYLFSLKEDTLWVADEVDATPILIPDVPQKPESLYRAIDTLLAKGRRFIADPILDPIHCGFSDSLIRYSQLRQRYPKIEIMMGIGNLTELTHADSAGVNTLLLGIASELGIRHVLTTQVSEHCRKAIKEADCARRILFHAHAEHIPPTGIDAGLMALHERKPFPYDAAEIAEFANAVKDPGFRIQVAADGVHIYNRDLHKTATDPFDLYPDLGVSNDGGHAFYLGVELGRAQIAWQLGKRYNQDEELEWGCAVEKAAEDLSHRKEAGVTLKEKQNKARQRKQN